VQLPPVPTVSDAERALLERKRLLERAWRASPYFLPLPSAKTGAPRARERGGGCGG
jgi:hypothetical protein